jgi:hypothetical protein
MIDHGQTARGAKCSAAQRVEVVSRSATARQYEQLYARLTTHSATCRATRKLRFIGIAGRPGAVNAASPATASAWALSKDGSPQGLCIRLGVLGRRDA